MRRERPFAWKTRPNDRPPVTQQVLGFPAPPAFAPRARAEDPLPSKEAAASVDGEKLAEKVLEYLRSCGAHGATSHEIAAGLGLSLVSVSPRLAPLQRRGLVCWARMPDGWPVRRKVEGQRVAAQVWIAGEFAT